jgi:hypothetical protein
MVHDYCHWCESEWVDGGIEITKPMGEVLRLVAAERAAQEARYTTNDVLRDGTGPDSYWLLPYTSGNAQQIEEDLRAEYESKTQAELPSWMLLVREEVAEAFRESDPARLQEELIQVAALCVSWVERLRARTGKCAYCAAPCSGKDKDDLGEHRLGVPLPLCPDCRVHFENEPFD